MYVYDIIKNIQGYMCISLTVPPSKLRDALGFINLLSTTSIVPKIKRVVHVDNKIDLDADDRYIKFPLFVYKYKRDNKKIDYVVSEILGGFMELYDLGYICDMSLSDICIDRNFKVYIINPFVFRQKDDDKLIDLVVGLFRFLYKYTRRKDYEFMINLIKNMYVKDATRMFSYIFGDSRHRKTI